jgi:hypothetical protein
MAINNVNNNGINNVNNVIMRNGVMAINVMANNNNNVIVMSSACQ